MSDRRNAGPMARFCIATALSFLGAGVSIAAEATVSDRALLAYVSTPYDTVAASHVTLGAHRGALVVADFVCADVCPNYTVRVVHYDVPKGRSCASMGGIERSVTVPVGIGETDKAFCFPKVIVDNWKRYVAAARIRME